MKLVRLTEYRVLPKSDVSFGKLAKILHFLATFCFIPDLFLSREAYDRVVIVKNS
jgi:hypothetical protein